MMLDHILVRSNYSEHFKGRRLKRHRALSHDYILQSSKKYLYIFDQTIFRKILLVFTKVSGQVYDFKVNVS